ncbi:Isoleucine--tRNA ligase [Chloropicon primus]|uniref:isoleucine--tRNA ligase n=1 Tax=Chloropicon primus TaxID=1764295 RepID=A0A5B8MQ75_9CHLO|nr:Isoleucine--tRNA ligase [Chloropicon primus]UPR01784.1 Isoleucine--tRNA ligase [Chloropicon primus]|eukprot:QDZ22563.1 Isoleucine--tRNA ligase [Chloropicon primus]
MARMANPAYSTWSTTTGASALATAKRARGLRACRRFSDGQGKKTVARCGARFGLRCPAYSSRVSTVVGTSSSLACAASFSRKPFARSVARVSDRQQEGLCVVGLRQAARGGCVKASGKKKDDDNPYSDTVLLPQTDFSMRANAKAREPELQAWWRENQVYEELLRQNRSAGGDNFTLHDGPPYANGTLHLGHAMNKVLKDIIVKHRLLKGKSAAFVPGWDCHGLPIELKVLQSLKSKERKGLTPMSMRGKARDFALKTIGEQAEQFKRYGVWGDYEKRYQTLDPEYEAKQLEVFGRMFMEGHIYRGLKPVNWSPSSRTALAEAELEYPPGHKSRSIYVAMPLAETKAEALEGLEASLAIWTTTPWTIPANLAVAVNSEIEYAVCKMEGGGSSHLIVASDLVESLSEKIGRALSIVAKLKGSELEGCTYKHPLYERTSPVVIGGDYITTESGTGLVHTAPGHGQDDFQVGQKYGLPILSPVDNAGRLTSEAGEEFEGLNVLGDANEAIIAALEREGALLLEELYEHKYPYDWRTKKPTIFRATEQWFASVDGFKKDALDAIDSVEWIPKAGVKRIRAMTSDRSDWCISRQRKWGVPIPVFYKKDSGEAIVTEETLKHVIDLVREKGSDAWFELPVEDLLPESLKAEASNLTKGEDTMDVWFDSGSSWAGVVSAREELNYPADLYLEGSDQHRGWFQSSLLTSVAVNGCAPYKTVLTHGFVLDEKGAKMSKSLGNIIDPKNIIEGGNNQKKDPAYGADTLRLWVSSVDYSSDVLIGPSILKQTSEIYRKLRGTIRFVLGNLHDFNPESDAVSYDSLPLFDKYILHQLVTVQEEVDSNFESFQFSKVFQTIQRFNVVDLSQFYLDVVKDRLYIRGSDSFERKSCQTVLKHMLDTLLPMIAPILPHLAEDAWQNLPFQTSSKSVFLHGLAEAKSEWKMSGADLQELEILRSVRSEVNRVAEIARKDKLIGSSLEAKVVIRTDSQELHTILSKYSESANGVDELRYLFICSQVDLKEGPAGEGVTEIPEVGTFRATIERAGGLRCARCWNYSDTVGTFGDHKELCDRCHPVVQGKKAVANVAA